MDKVQFTVIKIATSNNTHYGIIYHKKLKNSRLTADLFYYNSLYIIKITLNNIYINFLDYALYF